MYFFISERQTETGLRLFQPKCEFCLFCKDREENWGTVGDVPWKWVLEEIKENSAKDVRLSQKVGSLACVPLKMQELPSSWKEKFWCIENHIGEANGK